MQEVYADDLNLPIRGDVCFYSAKGKFKKGIKNRQLNLGWIGANCVLSFGWICLIEQIQPTSLDFVPGFLLNAAPAAHIILLCDRRK